MRNCQTGETVLHAACRSSHRDASAVLDTVRFWCEREPALLWSRDRWGDLPIHAAASSNHNNDASVMAYLASHDPRMLRARGRHGRLPIHQACCRAIHSNNSAANLMAVIRVVVEGGGPETLLLPDDSGSLPLHLLLVSTNTATAASLMKCVQFLVQSNPESLAIPNGDQEPAFLLAAATSECSSSSSSSSLEIVNFLLRTNPAVISSLSM